MAYLIAVWMIVMLIPAGLAVGYATDFHPVAGLLALFVGCFAVIGSAMLLAAVT